jgi:uncharacterized membrane-anchored protein YitT (DUF2179 family)
MHLITRVVGGIVVGLGLGLVMVVGSTLGSLVAVHFSTP